MHTAGENGMNSLLDVVNHYNAVPGSNNLDNRLQQNGNPQQLNLSNNEKASLVAFLRTLTGRNIYTDTRWSDPFANGGLVVIPGATSIALYTPDEVTVSPTIASSFITIDFPSSMQGEPMYILNMSGSAVYSGSMQKKVDVTAFPSGIYYLKFRNGETQKIIKQ